MKIKLKKSLFARDHYRERNLGDFFNKTSNGLTLLIPLIINVFFNPALIVISFVSKELIIALANISLSLGYLTNFFYRLYYKEVSIAEVIVTAISVVSFIILACFFIQPVIAATLASVLSCANKIAAFINLYFLLKHVLIPPIKKFIEYIAKKMGHDISDYYFSKPLLTLSKDRAVVDHLLLKHFGHDSFSPDYKREELACFNNLLIKLSAYINKYDESIFGYLRNTKKILALEEQITQLTLHANTDPSYAFIKKKIGFKETKIQLLQRAKEEVLEAIAHPERDNKSCFRFFQVPLADRNAAPEDQLNVGLNCIDDEINRQQRKLESLQSCLATP